MFILLKFMLLFFRPIIWIIIIFFIALFSRNEKRKRSLFKCGLFLLLFFSNPIIIRQIIQWYEVKPVSLSPSDRYNAGIVLGGFVSYNKIDDEGYFNNASDRFIQTALLYKTGHISKIVIAAGNGYMVKHDFKEADFIKQHLIELGIPSGDIFTDPFSRNTQENADNSKRIVDSVHLQPPFLLISSALHLPRAKIVFIKKGIDVRLYPCDFASKNVGNNFFEDYLLPSAPALSDWNNLLKEIAGLIVYKL